MTDTTYSLAELLICAASECWRDDGEVLATGIGVIPRLAASLAMLSSNRELLMTDSEAFMVAEPVPLGARNGYEPKCDSWMGFSRIFDNVWGGRRHALAERNLHPQRRRHAVAKVLLAGGPDGALPGQSPPERGRQHQQPVRQEVPLGRHQLRQPALHLGGAAQLQPEHALCILNTP